jgi:hypothetical protein
LIQSKLRALMSQPCHEPIISFGSCATADGHDVVAHPATTNTSKSRKERFSLIVNVTKATGGNRLWRVAG